MFDVYYFSFNWASGVSPDVLSTLSRQRPVCACLCVSHADRYGHATGRWVSCVSGGTPETQETYSTLFVNKLGLTP